ncbi:MAG: hypothetical protein RLZZ58_2255 [Pseudomonadota bacterium]
MPSLKVPVSVSQFVAPHPRLRPYLTTYYFTSIDSPDGEAVSDWLNPEWASVRYCYRGETRGNIHPLPMEVVPPVHFSGPTTRAQPFATHMARVASIGILPAGWARFIAEPASNWADRSGEMHELATPVDFDALLAPLRAAASVADMAALFDAALLAILDQKPLVSAAMEARINTAHVALLDPAISTVAALADRLGLTMTQLERFSRRMFGFPPKRLLNRQRFVRTLAVIMRDPAAPWVRALDANYYDQAHFNRDFHKIFGMSPEQFRRHPHPVLSAAAAARIKALGDPLQALQRPPGA